MSTKLYGGRRVVLDSDFDLLRWQETLDALRAKVKAIADQQHIDEMLRVAVYHLDRLIVGLPWPEGGSSPLGLAWKVIDDACQDIAKGRRHPLYDTEVQVCWRLLPDRRTVLVIIYAEQRDLSRMVEEALGLEDYHFQDQCDPPDDCTWEEMQERGRVWEAALGDWNNPPVARFHTFEVCPAPKYPPLLGWMDPPPVVVPLPLEDRVRAVAFDLLFLEHKGDATKDNVLTVLRQIERNAREGGPLHARLLEIQEEVRGKLIESPTYEDLKRKPRG